MEYGYFELTAIFMLSIQILFAILFAIWAIKKLISDIFGKNISLDPKISDIDYKSSKTQKENEYFKSKMVFFNTKRIQSNRTLFQSIYYNHLNTLGLDYKQYGLYHSIDYRLNKLTNSYNRNTKYLINLMTQSYKCIFIEDLTLRVSKEFYYFRKLLLAKCQSEGILLIYIDPKNTSRTCNMCKHINLKNPILTGSKNFKCGSCRYIVDKDMNAALNIQDKGLETLSDYGLQVDKSKKRNFNYYGYYRMLS